MKLNGSCKGWYNHSEDSGESFSAEELNGTVEYEVSVNNGKPSHIKIDASFDKGDLAISINFVTRNGANRTESFTGGQCIADLDDCKDGRYTLTATAKDVKNVSVKYTLV